MYVFFADISEIPQDKILLEKYKALLSVRELEKLQNIKLPKKQKEFLITRTLTRTILADFLNCTNKELIFENSPNGRPQLKNFAIDFNISHSHNLVFLALSESKIGIDIEFIKKRNYLEFAQRFYAPEEFEFLNKLSPEKQKEHFYILWTQKEALIKALDLSFIANLNTINLASKYKFKTKSFLLTQEYILSITHPKILSNNSLQIKKIIPFISVCNFDEYKLII